MRQESWTGYSCHLRTQDRRTPLQLAALYGHKGAVVALCDLGANINLARKVGPPSSICAERARLRRAPLRCTSRPNGATRARWRRCTGSAPISTGPTRRVAAFHDGALFEHCSAGRRRSCLDRGAKRSHGHGGGAAQARGRHSAAASGAACTPIPRRHARTAPVSRSTGRHASLARELLLGWRRTS